MAHSIGKTIAELRKAKGWTQVQLAEKLGVSDKAVSKWESEGGFPEITQLPVLASIFNVTIDYLMVGNEKKDKPTIITEKKEEIIEANDPRILRAIHSGILQVDEILKTKDYKLIKKALETYPISEFEVNYLEIQNAKELLAAKNWRKLFRFAVNKNVRKLIVGILDRNTELCEKILELLCNNLTDYPYVKTFPGQCTRNKEYLHLRNAPTTQFRANCSYKSILEYIENCKRQILDDCRNLYDKESKIAELTKEYFESEIEKGNTEIVIIKLCVRLEAILRCDYHYEGDFSEMLNEYCSKYGREDDGWGYDVEAKFVKYLHKLRKCRNNIVHSERTEEAMTIDEIKFCIEYICRMG